MKTFKEFVAQQQVDEENLLVTGVKIAAPYVKSGVKIAAPYVKSAVRRIAAAARNVERKISPPVNNRLGQVPKKTSMIDGRAPSTPKQVTHLQRKMDPAELASANKTGYFQPRPKDMKVDWDNGGAGNSKWWSKADDTSIFGRPYTRNNTVNVRVPRSNYSADRAISVRGAEVMADGGKWVPAIDKSITARASRAAYKLGRLAGKIDEDV